MTQPHLLVIVFHFLFFSSGLAAQINALGDGTIVEMTPCPKLSRTYDKYVEAFKRWQAIEVEAANREGFRTEIPKDLSQGLLSRDEYERNAAYAGFECQRITYMS